DAGVCALRTGPPRPGAWPTPRDDILSLLGAVAHPCATWSMPRDAASFAGVGIAWEAVARPRPSRLEAPGTGVREKKREARISARRDRAAGGSEALFVADVGHGALVGLAVGGCERVAAAGDDVLGTHGELAAPWGTPGQAQAQAFPLVAGLAAHVDHPADDVGAERAVATAHAQALAVPAFSQAG